MFSLKAPRYATNRRVLGEAGATIERFFAGGVMALKCKLGPINWQFMPTKRYDPVDFEAFLKLLPREVDGRALRYVVEVRHESFVRQNSWRWRGPMGWRSVWLGIARIHRSRM